MHASLTISFQRKRCRWTQNTHICHGILHQTDVTSHIWRLHLGNIQVSCVLGDEAATVFGNEWGELIEHPAVDDLWKHKSGVDKPGKCGTLHSQICYIRNLFSHHGLDQGWACYHILSRSFMSRPSLDQFIGSLHFFLSAQAWVNLQSLFGGFVWCTTRADPFMKIWNPMWPLRRNNCPPLF